MTLDIAIVEKMLGIIHSHRITLTDEKFTQAEIAELLLSHSIPFKREVRLSDEDIVDFMIDDWLAVEVKLKGQKRAIFRQLKRYAEHAEVKALMLVTGLSMGLPGELEGKPVFYASLSRAWV